MFKHWIFKVIGVGFVLLVLTFCVLWSSKKTVAFGEIRAGDKSWGYKIESRYIRDGVGIEFWNTQGFKFSFYRSDMYFWKIKQEKWLSNKRAILLDLEIAEKEDSIYPSRPTKILFDFKRGELYITSTANLWRNGDRETQQPDYSWTDKDWMTEEEFQKELERFNE